MAEVAAKCNNRSSKSSVNRRGTNGSHKVEVMQMTKALHSRLGSTNNRVKPISQRALVVVTSRAKKRTASLLSHHASNSRKIARIRSRSRLAKSRTNGEDPRRLASSMLTMTTMMMVLCSRHVRREEAVGVEQTPRVRRPSLSITTLTMMMKTRLCSRPGSLRRSKVATGQARAI